MVILKWSKLLRYFVNTKSNFLIKNRSDPMKELGATEFQKTFFFKSIHKLLNSKT